MKYKTYRVISQNGEQIMSPFKWCYTFQLGWNMNSGLTTFSGCYQFRIGRLYFLLWKKERG